MPVPDVDPAAVAAAESLRSVPGEELLDYPILNALLTEHRPLALGDGVARTDTAAREWIGLMPEPGRTLILSAEDDAVSQSPPQSSAQSPADTKAATFPDGEPFARRHLLGLRRRCQPDTN